MPTGRATPTCPRLGRLVRHLTATEDGRFYDYWVNDNETSCATVEAGGVQPDVETKRAVKFIRDSAGRSEPLFSGSAPGPPRALDVRRTARRRFPNSGPPRALLQRGRRERQAVLGAPDRVQTDEQIDNADRFQRFRLRSLRAVEDMIEAVVQALAETGRLEQTYIVFTSDNGLLMGQHRAVGRKGNAYEGVDRDPP